MWDWAAFFHYAASPYLLEGAAPTLGISAASILLGLICGLAAALARTSRWAIWSRSAAAYVWLMRGTPVLVQLVFIFIGLLQLGIRLVATSLPVPCRAEVADCDYCARMPAAERRGA